MLPRRRGRQRHGRDGQQQAQATVRPDHQAQGRPHVPKEGGKAMVHEPVAVRVETACDGTWTDSVFHARDLILPGFGQPHGKDKDRRAAHRRRDRRQCLFA